MSDAMVSFESVEFLLFRLVLFSQGRNDFRDLLYNISGLQILS